MRVLIATFFVSLSVACAHVESAAPLRASDIDQRLLTLENDFVRFTTVDLTRETAEDSVAALEAAVGDLQRLRLRYVSLLDRGADDRQTPRVLLRMAELHLDLAARARRLPYPLESGAEEQAIFDRRLGRIAAPLEAAGVGVLEQLVYDDRETREGERASLYLALHRDAQLSTGDAIKLRAELDDEGPFAAPRRLLEAGRLGRRASRR